METATVKIIGENTVNALSSRVDELISANSVFVILAPNSWPDLVNSIHVVHALISH